MQNPTYLGDAVYAEFDGFGIKLMLNRHDAPVAVYLEPDTFNALANFVKAIATRRAEKSSEIVETHDGHHPA